jgi:hypothetical protein
MSCLASANLEAGILTTEEQNNRPNAGPVLLRNRRQDLGDWVVGRVTDAVDGQLENGNLPA